MGVYIEGTDMPNSGQIELIIRPHGKVLTKTRGIYAKAMQIDLVRCGECKQWDKAVNGHLNIDDHLCRRALRWTLNTDYCSDGERRADV